MCIQKKTMIIYQSNIRAFIEQCKNSMALATSIKEDAKAKGLGIGGLSEFRSWENSLPFMSKVLDSNEIDKDIDVAIEYKPTTAKNRIDFMVYGRNSKNEDSLVIIELKQWSSVQKSNLEDFVFTTGGNGQDDYWHPSYQAYNYLNILKSFNQYIWDNQVQLKACSYLHNMPEPYDSLLANPSIYPLVKEAPVFLEGQNDADKLRDFIHRSISSPRKRLLYEIDESNIRPSAEFSHMLLTAIKGTPFFSYDDNQAYAVSTTVQQVNQAIESHQRRTIIINGGPGTGKSVVAINILGKLLNPPEGQKRRNACYCTASFTPKTVFSEDLIGNDFRKSAIKELFKGIGQFSKCKSLDYDCILVDEAHRAFTWKFGYAVKRNVDMIDRLFNASRVNVFFIDKDQVVTKDDQLTIDMIKEYARRYSSRIIEGESLDLVSQFRCLGGETYINFINTLLGYNTNELSYCKTKYDVKVFDTATELSEAIFRKNKNSNPSRIVAGFTHPWISKDKPDEDTNYDWVLDNGNFKMKWNKHVNYSWLNDPTQEDRIGCIHTVQGIDLQYCGVIIGKDMAYKDGKVVFDSQKNTEFSTSSKKKIAGERISNEKFIRNIYKVLLTRGVKGTYIYCEDKPLNDFLKKELNK